MTKYSYSYLKQWTIIIYQWNNYQCLPVYQTMKPLSIKNIVYNNRILIGYINEMFKLWMVCSMQINVNWKLCYVLFLGGRYFKFHFIIIVRWPIIAFYHFILNLVDRLSRWQQHIILGNVMNLVLFVLFWHYLGWNKF